VAEQALKIVKCSVKRIIEESQESKIHQLIRGRMKIKNFYKTPVHIGGSSIVRELSEKYGVKQSEVFVFQPDYIYYEQATIYNKTKFYLKIVGNQNVVLMAVKESNEEEIQGNWKLSEILTALVKKNPDVEVSIEILKELIREKKLGVKFNKSKSKDHGTLWHYREIKKAKIKAEKAPPQKVEDLEDDFFRDL
jgi:hypothetical protein